MDMVHVNAATVFAMRPHLTEESTAMNVRSVFVYSEFLVCGKA